MTHTRQEVVGRAVPRPKAREPWTVKDALTQAALGEELSK